MARDPFADDGSDPDVGAVLDALEDEDCRALITRLETPMTASELSEATGVPLSTTYRKLDLLTEASLLAEQTEIRKDGQHTTRYLVDFEAVHVVLDEDRDLALEVDRPDRSPEERLAELWSEVREET